MYILFIDVVTDSRAILAWVKSLQNVAVECRWEQSSGTRHYLLTSKIGKHHFSLGPSQLDYQLATGSTRRHRATRISNDDHP